MARRPKKVNEAALADALRKHGGNKSHAAKACGITRQSVQERVENSPLLQQVLKEADEELLDIAEGQLKKSVRRGDRDMVRYVLDRKGKKRGYGNSVSIGADEATAEAICAGLGGDLAAFRAALAQLGVNQSEIP